MGAENTFGVKSLTGLEADEFLENLKRINGKYSKERIKWEI